MAMRSAAPARVKVWDLPVRLFHWALAASFLGAWLFAEDGRDVHEFLGCLALGLIAFRVVWGFVGSPHARFADFWPTPRKLSAYLRQMMRREEPRYLGHNPAAAVMIIFLLVMVILIGGSGWLMTTDWGFGREWLEEAHELLVHTTLIAVVLHAGAAVYESLRHRENLVRAMIDGHKRAP